MNLDHERQTFAEVAMGRKRRPLSMRAARMLLVARDLAAADGEIPGGQRALAKALGNIHLKNVREALAELEDRRLARRVGSLRVIVGGERKTFAVDEQTEPPPLQQRWRRDRGRPREVADARYPGAVPNPEFRWLRARMGGLERSLRDIKAQRDEARTLIAKIEARGDTTDTAATALRADLEHAADCGDPDCAICLRIVEQLEDPDGPYLAVTEGV